MPAVLTWKRPLVALANRPYIDTLSLPLCRLNLYGPKRFGDRGMVLQARLPARRDPL